MTGIVRGEGHTRTQWAVAILSNMALFTYGLQAGWISPMTKILQSYESPTGRILTDKEISWIASVPSLSAVPGVIIGLNTVDRYGRRIGIIMVSLFQALTWIIILFPASTTSLIIARICCGIGGGACFHVVPMYIKEIAQDNIRGTLASLFILAQSIGILVMYTIGSFMSYYTIAWVVVGLPIVTLLLFLKAPESPSFLVKEGKVNEATETLAFLRGLHVDDKRVQTELDVIVKEDEYFKSLPRLSLASIFKEKPWRKAFLIMICVVLVHGTSGAFSIINYAATLLADSDVKFSPDVQSLGIPICMIVGAFITMALVDKLGRKPILATAFIGTAVAFFTLATAAVLKENLIFAPEWLNIVMIMVVILCYGFGVSPIPFMLMPEIFNFQIRAKLMGYLVMTAWFMSFFQLLVFSSLTSSYGPYVGFYMFTLINTIGAAIVIFLLPETKGKTIEEIERELRGDLKDKSVEAASGFTWKD